MHGRPRKASKPEDEEASAAKGEKLRALQSQLLSNHRHKMYPFSFTHLVLDPNIFPLFFFN